MDKEPELPRSKNTREEKKMEAIIKAFERMEKVEQRKLEKQNKRREFDPQQSCSVTSTSEAKDVRPEQSQDHSQQYMLKGKRRRKGRVHTTSNRQQISRKMLDPVVTLETEHTSLISPPRSSSMSVAEHLTDIRPLTSKEAHSHRDLAEINFALAESINRLKVGLSFAELLIEAATGSPETTFKFPDTKKAIINEWLKTADPNLSNDIASLLEYSNHAENNNSTHSQQAA